MFHATIEVDSDYPVPTWVSSHLKLDQVWQIYCDNLENVRYQKKRHHVCLNRRWYFGHVKNYTQVTPLRGLMIAFDIFWDVRNYHF